MIYKAQFTSPIAWLESSKGKSYPIKDIEDFAYELSVSNIEGRTFEFKPGLNIIVGPNGSGKTSLINVLSKVNFCEDEMSSTFNRGDAFRYASSGLYDLCKVTANYGISTFRYKTIGTYRKYTNGDSMPVGIARIKTNSKSRGQAAMLTLESILELFRTNGNIVRGSTNGDATNFGSSVLKPLEKCHEKTPSETLRSLADYYVSNNDDSGKQVTFLFDCPDDGLDIPNLKLLYGLLIKAIAEPDKYQFIVSLNSMMLIKSLMRIEGTNVIEIHKGYLKAIWDTEGFIPDNYKQAKKEDGK